MNDSLSPFDKGYEAARKALQKAQEKAEQEAIESGDSQEYWLGWNSYIHDNQETIGL